MRTIPRGGAATTAPSAHQDAGPAESQPTQEQQSDDEDENLYCPTGRCQCRLLGHPPEQILYLLPWRDRRGDLPFLSFSFNSPATLFKRVN